jgi:hypothetical protein
MIPITLIRRQTQMEMEMEKMIEVVHSKACSPRRKGEDCPEPHPACDDVISVVQTLKKAIRVDAVPVDGKVISGWLIPD